MAAVLERINVIEDDCKETILGNLSFFFRTKPNEDIELLFMGQKYAGH